MILKKKGFNKTYFVAFLFLIISSLLILVWFRDGFFYGGGDIGLPTYNPQRILEISRYIWWEAVAPGFLIPQAVTSITSFIFLYFLQLFGVGSVGIQAILFFIILFLMGFGTYLLTLSFIGADKKVYAFIGGLFYMFNPYMMVQVWHRFNNTSFFFVAAIPFLVIFWRSWIKQGDFLNLLLFLIVNVLASYMFGTMAYIIPLWLILFLFTTSEILFPWQNKSNFYKVSGRFFFGFIAWIFISSWWLIPIITASPGMVSKQHNIGESILTLAVISKQAIIPYSLQMINSFYTFEQQELGQIYNSFLFLLIPWLGVIGIFYGIAYAIKKKHLASVVFIYLIIIMLSKGMSSPFGQPFLFLFSRFFAIGLLRNPFEKIGILLPLISSILFVIGLENLLNQLCKLGQPIKNIFLLLLLVTMGVYYWPMYQGTIFGSNGKLNYVKIPNSYQDANKWLNEKLKQDNQSGGKILHLPLSRRDIVTYKWEKGYHGAEPSAELFTSLPSIAHGLNLNRVDDSLTALSLVFDTPFNARQDKILKLLQDFNIRFIVLHKDLDYLGGDTYSPEDTEKLLNNLKFISKQLEIGNLIIYKVNDEYFAPKIEIVNNLTLAYPQENTVGIWSWLVSSSSYFISPVNRDLSKGAERAVNQTIIFPENSFSYPEASASSINNTYKQLETELNVMAGATQYTKALGTIHPKTEQTVQALISASQELVSIYSSTKSADQYVNKMNDVFTQLYENSPLYLDVAKTTIDNILKLHEVTLSLIEKTTYYDKVQLAEIDKRISDFLTSKRLYPRFPYHGLVSDVNQRQIFDFTLQKGGQYELLMTESSVTDDYVDKLLKLDFLINGQTTSLYSQKIDNVLSFGKIYLPTGFNEISFTNPQPVNLVSWLADFNTIGNAKLKDNDITMTVTSISPAAVETPVLQTTGQDIFQISFDAEISENTGLYIQVLQDNDAQSNGQKVPSISFLQHLNSTKWQGSYNIKLPALSLLTRQAKVRFVGLIPDGVTNLNSASNITIKNLNIIRLLNNSILLSNKFEPSKENLSQIQFKQKNSIKYEGSLKITSPAFLVFKETYDPGWKLTLFKGDQKFEQEEHYLANLYGNGWWLQDTGEYNFELEFEPQSKVTLGIYLAGIMGLLVICLTVFQVFRRYERF